MATLAALLYRPEDEQRLGVIHTPDFRQQLLPDPLVRGLVGKCRLGELGVFDGRRQGSPRVHENPSSKHWVPVGRQEEQEFILGEVQRLNRRLAQRFLPLDTRVVHAALRQERTTMRS
jgi:hypothetical protein